MLGWTAENVRNAQRRDPEIGFIVDLMKSNSGKPDWSAVESKSSAVKSIWHEWERLVIVEGLLFRRWTGLSGEPDRRQVLFPREYRREFIRKAHSGATGGLLGRKKTEQQFSVNSYWPGWRADVADSMLGNRSKTSQSTLWTSIRSRPKATFTFLRSSTYFRSGPKLCLSEYIRRLWSLRLSWIKSSLVSACQRDSCQFKGRNSNRSCSIAM